MLPQQQQKNIDEPAFSDFFFGQKIQSFSIY